MIKTILAVGVLFLTVMAVLYFGMNAVMKFRRLEDDDFQEQRKATREARAAADDLEDTIARAEKGKKK